jgi:hypothetical protein
VTGALLRHSTCCPTLDAVSAQLVLPLCPVQDVATAVSDATLLERISKVMGYISQTSGAGNLVSNSARAQPQQRPCAACLMERHKHESWRIMSVQGWSTLRAQLLVVRMPLLRAVLCCAVLQSREASVVLVTASTSAAY